jgi:hypothetical protein
MDLLKEQLSDQVIDQLSKQAGTNKKKTKVAAESALSGLVSALARNASTPQGARSLASAVERDHDGSILDDLAGFLGGQAKPRNEKMLNGEGILRHVLGDRQENTANVISKKSGIDKASSGKIMQMLAPMVLGALGKSRQSKSLDVSDLANLLTNSARENERRDKTAKQIGGMLDKDDLMDLLKGQMSDDVLGFLSKEIGEDKSKTAAATEGVFSVLTSALSRKVTNKKEVKGLAAALDRDHDGSILDDVVGFLGGQKSAQNSSMLDGAGIIGHILGGKQSGVVDMIAKMSGVDKSSSGKLLMMLAPVVMGALGRSKRNRELDLGGLASLLSSSARTHERKHEHASLIGKILDKDQDGSMIDDIAKIGFNLFKRK